MCRLFDREELPWPSCSLQWKGKQPSWRRVGRRLIPDVGPNRYQSYSVIGIDRSGLEWQEVKTFYKLPRLSNAERRWWYSPRNPTEDYPDHVEI